MKPSPDRAPADSGGSPAGLLAALLVVVSLAPACREAPLPDLEPLGPIDEHVEWTRVLPFEGPGPTRASAFTAEADDGLLAAEFDTRRLSVWRLRGGAFRPVGASQVAGLPPTSAQRAAGGRILVTTIDGGLVQFDRSGSEEERRIETPVSPLWNALPVLEGGLLLVGAIADPLEEQLHLWVPEAGGIQLGFFRPPVSEELFHVAQPAGRPAVALRGDTVAAAFSLSDSLTLLDILGSVKERIALPFGHYAVGSDAPAEPDSDAISEWMGRTWFVMDVWWLTDGTFLVQTGREGGVGGFRTALLGLSRDGSVLFDLAESPRLAAVAGERLYFLEPGEGPVSRILVGRLRR